MAAHQIISTSYPYLRVRFSIRGYEETAIALVDTGFTGALAIPATIFNGKLGLPDARTVWELADQSKISAPVYMGSIEIIDFSPMSGAITIVGNEYILGRGVIDRFKVTFDHGKRVIVEP